MPKDKEVKLTDNQRQLLKVMRSGINLKNYPQYNAFDMMGNGGKPVHVSTANSLIRLGLIEPSKHQSDNVQNKIFVLTETGKNIKL